MKRPIRAEELELWSRIAATVRPRPGRQLPGAGRSADLHPAAVMASSPGPEPKPELKSKAIRVIGPPDVIEPNRRRRLERSREDIGARLDLHGLRHDQARSRVSSFIRNSHDLGIRAVLIITGKGVEGQGILKRFVPEWLSEAPLVQYVAGIAPAHHVHGGDGAIYVALKRAGTGPKSMPPLPI